jgi:integrase
MAPRQRKDPRLPDHTRERGGYYSWTSPVDGREYGLGRDRRNAIQQALEANAHMAGSKPTLLQKITGAAMTWGEWCDVFEKLLAERESARTTIAIRKSQMVRLRKVFDADRPANGITTKDCAKAIDAIKAEGKHRTAQAFRSFLIDSFDRMIAKGVRPDNPARVLDAVRVKVMRARLQFDVFMRVYEAEQTVWAKNAYALAIVSGQDRESCSEAQVRDIRDGAWCNERSKTGARIALPLELRLDCFGMSLGDVVRQCRTTGVLSRYLIHQTQSYGNSPAGAQIWRDTITRHFTDTLAALQLDWGDKNPPTFHEIRSLSGRLYRKQGNVSPQELFGHKDPRTTSIYTDERGEWLRVSIRK